MLWKWWTEVPLTGGKANQWPFEGQPRTPTADVQDPALFPGVKAGGKNARLWSKPVSERAYYGKVKEAMRVIQAERASARDQSQEHVFEGVDLDKVTTHTLKKTTVTMLKDKG
eukprot:881101-Amphidinium_carterae.1